MPADAVQGYTTVEVGIGGGEGEITETEGPQNADAAHAQGIIEWVRS